MARLPYSFLFTQPCWQSLYKLLGTPLGTHFTNVLKSHLNHFVSTRLSVFVRSQSEETPNKHRTNSEQTPFKFHVISMLWKFSNPFSCFPAKTAFTVVGGGTGGYEQLIINSKSFWQNSCSGHPKDFASGSKWKKNLPSFISWLC